MLKQADRPAGQTNVVTPRKLRSPRDFWLCVRRAFPGYCSVKVNNAHTLTHDAPGRQKKATAAVELQCSLDAALPTRTECTCEPRAKPAGSTFTHRTLNAHSRTH